MKTGLTGKVSLVTGAARGIGKAIASKLAANGCRIALNDIDSSELDITLKELTAAGANAISLPGDISETASVKSMIKSVIDAWGGIDILVNNAGIIGKNNLMMRTAEADFDRLIAVNLRSAYLCSKYFLRSFAGKSGRIINVSSVAGTTGLGMVDYSTSKGGLTAMTRSLAHEVGGMNITVNAIAPGVIDTRMTGSLPADIQNLMLSRLSIKRMGTTEEVADLVCFLASEEASYITGQVIGIDGGFA
jgi:3-oxoacyl-[acyl-carrier protein] reductase